MEKNQERKQFIIALIIVIILLIVGLSAYNSYLRTNLSKANCQTLEEITKQQNFSFQLTMKSESDSLKSFAGFISQINIYDEKETILEALNYIVENTSFEHTAFSLADGHGVTNLDTPFDLSQRPYFDRAMLGETVISEPLPSPVEGVEIITISTPVEKNGEIIGVLVGSYNTKNLDELFLPTFGGTGYAYIVTNDGEIICKSTNSYTLTVTNNIFDVMSKADFYSGDDFETFKENLIKNEAGHAEYNLEGKKRIMHYDTIHVNGWNIIVVVPDEIVTQIPNKILVSSVILTLMLAVIFTMLIIYIFRSQKKHLNQLMNLAYTDELTGGKNYNKFKIDAEAAIKNNPDKSFILVKMDVDRFKLINDLYGFEIGDKILKIMSASIQRAINKETDIYARINSDQFIALLNIESLDDIEKRRIKFEKHMGDRSAELIDFKMVIPEGRYIIENHSDDFAQMLEKVNFAHYMAKKSDYYICDYNEETKTVAIHEKEIENKMEAALADEEFIVYMQPKFRLSDEIVVGAEALVRWVTSDNKTIYPNSFIPLFEQNGFITKLDMYMFEKVCKIIRKWLDMGVSPVVVSANFSRIHLKNKNFVNELSDIADKYFIPHNLLEIELTETAIYDNLDVLEVVLQNIHKAGFTLSMDDFGTGYSSLGMLKNISVDVLKIDRGFFTDSKDSERAKTVIGSVMEMARSLNIHTVAEGVETKEHIDLLKELGCDIVQGYYYAKPMPAMDFDIMMGEIAEIKNAGI